MSAHSISLSNDIYSVSIVQCMENNHHYYFYDDAIWLRSSKNFCNNKKIKIKIRTKNVLNPNDGNHSIKAVADIDADDNNKQIATIEKYLQILHISIVPHQKSRQFYIQNAAIF